MTPPGFMSNALLLANQASCVGEVPVGAIIIKEGIIVASAHNLTETRIDPTAHAEILAIRSACETLETSRLVDCDLYVTLEPCPMCAQAISFARIRRLYFGAYDIKGGAVENGARLYRQPTCHHQPEVYGGINERECGEMLRGFFKDRR